MEGWDRQIKRAEAAHLILDIMKRLDILWNREINVLPGWEGVILLPWEMGHDKV